ncbi:MAG TPA: adenylate/guanylate cyclase domain-containing protein [Stellaceae bacterium]|nr:adenylate/guanylate cyclase domain-containing protein [Stellaceae bacterium]
MDLRIDLRKALVPVAIAVISALLATAAVRYISFLGYAERFIRDFELTVLSRPQPQSSDIVVIGITEQTLERFAYRSPIDRKFLADLLLALQAKGVRAIGLDVLFDQPTEPAKDDDLRQVIQTLKTPLVISYVAPEDAVDESGAVDKERRAFLDGFVPPRDRVMADIKTDAFDGTVRWMVPGRQMADGTYIPGFARGLLAKLGIATPAEELEIAWRGRPDAETEPFGEIPAQNVAVLPPVLFKNKIALIGAELSLTDRHRTPFAAVYEGNRGTIPGVVIHAHSIDQLLSGRQPPGIGEVGDFLCAVLLAAVGAALGASTTISLHWRIPLGVLAVLLWWVGGGALFHYAGIMIALVTPSFGFAAAMWGSEAVTGHEARQQKVYIQGVFSRYVSPKVVHQLLSDPKRLSLEGERREMTFLFTDVAGFTTLSEGVESHQLAQVLNEYLDGMCQVILKYDGTVDKFIGDAVFAIFNAPTDQSDHAERAVRCALDIDRFAEQFRAGQNAAGVPFGVTRIGIHGGTATVGNFGSHERMEYTALGDAVNTASRLEGLNKYFGTRICVSEVTSSRCRNVAFRPIGLVVVKGKTQALGINEPLSEERAAADYIARYRQAYQRLEAGAEDALALFEALHAENPYDGCVAVHLERLRAGTRSTEIAMTEK